MTRSTKGTPSTLARRPIAAPPASAHGGAGSLRFCQDLLALQEPPLLPPRTVYVPDMLLLDTVPV